MSKFNTWIPSLALAFGVAATGVTTYDHFNPPIKSTMDTTEVVKAVMPGVVRISVTNPPESAGEEEEHGTGSGFVIDGKNGYIVTNNHVAGKASKIIIQLANDKKYVGTLVGADELSDIAVIQITPEKGTVLPQQTFADSDKVRLGEQVLAIGSPFGFRNSVSFGVISAVNRDLENPVQRLIQNDVAVNPGNSGGPLFNKKGEVVGVNNEIFSRTGQSAGISFAIPANLAKMVAETLIANKDHKMHWGYMGIMMEMTKDGPKKDAVEPDFPLNVSIKDVLPDSPAAKAGLKAGDIITSINGQEVSSGSEISHKILPLQVGGKADITYLRGGKQDHTVVTLGEAMKKAEAKNDNDGSPKEAPPTPMPDQAPKFHFGIPRQP